MNPHRPKAGNLVHRTARLLLAIVMALTLPVLLACTAAPSDPTPDIHATAAAGIAATREADRSIETTITARVEQTKDTEPTSTTEPSPDIAATITARLQGHKEVSPSIASNKEPNGFIQLHPAKEPAAGTAANKELNRSIAATVTARLDAHREVKPTSTIVDQDTSETISGTTWRGITIAPENRCSPYDSDEYRYSPSVEPRIVDAQGGIYGPYTGTWFESIKETDIEHIVARSEAHDSGLCAAGRATWSEFASDLLNLTLASPSVNRHQKSDNDIAEWLPDLNQCWYVDRTLQVRREYGLTIDRAEADAVDRILAGCQSTEMVVLVPGTSTIATPTPTAAATPTQSPDVDALALWDDNGNGRITCAEARAHGIAPVRRGHPAYQYMRDADGDGVVCE